MVNQRFQKSVVLPYELLNQDKVDLSFQVIEGLGCHLYLYMMYFQNNTKSILYFIVYLLGSNKYKLPKPPSQRHKLLLLLIMIIIIIEYHRICGFCNWWMVVVKISVDLEWFIKPRLLMTRLLSIYSEQNPELSRQTGIPNQDLLYQSLTRETNQTLKNF